MFEEADIEYQHVAFFNTQIVLRNAFQVTLNVVIRSVRIFKILREFLG